jgi:TetR/AcrR family transcriptional regulator, transcriptional repressor for nem operon
MARARTFDSDGVLMAAANAFRLRGYRNVSIGELEEATGLVSGSIYNAFGSKAGLFRAALHKYVTSFVGGRLDVFAGGSATLEDLERLFLTVLEPPLADRGGCLVTNSIIEFGSADELAAPDLELALDMVREAIGRVLERELGQGDAGTAATRLVLLYHGILALSRSNTSFEDMAEAVRAEFAALRAQRDKSKSKTREPRNKE